MLTSPAADIGAWILGPASRALSPADFVTQLAGRCERAGLPLLRVSTSLRTLHPEVFALKLTWSRAAGAEAELVRYSVQETQRYRGSPAEYVIERGVSLAVPLEDAARRPSHPLYEEQAALGATEYLIHPLPYHDGRRTFISWSTDRPGGFGAEGRAVLDALLPLLSLRLELLAAHHATASLLEVYLGRNAAARVLSGSFKRGSGTTIHAALWYCDMRGFTRLGDRLTPQALVALLDRYFEALAGPIAAHGGEILKFVGDAALALFPVDARGPEPACRAALQAAEEALGAVGALEVPGEAGALSLGIGLHVGHVVYGNIGARERLDFTVIGGSVNEVARVEALCKEVGAPLLLTGDFRQHLDRPDVVPVGRFALRGVSAARDVFTLAGLGPARAPGLASSGA